MRHLRIGLGMPTQLVQAGMAQTSGPAAGQAEGLSPPLSLCPCLCPFSISCVSLISFLYFCSSSPCLSFHLLSLIPLFVSISSSLSGFLSLLFFSLYPSLCVSLVLLLPLLLLLPLCLHLCFSPVLWFSFSLSLLLNCRLSSHES